VIKLRLFLEALRKWIALNTSTLVEEPELNREGVLRQIATTNEWATKYDSAYPRYVYEMEPKAAMRKFRFSDRDLILDAGSGTGRYSAILARNGVKVVAVDHSLSSLRVCRKKGDIQVILAVLSALPFRSLVFDGIICGDVLQHISHDKRERCLYELKRIMKEGASLAITVLNHSLPYVIRPDRQGFFSGKVFYHRFLYYELKTLLMRFFRKENIAIRGILNLKDFPFKIWLLDRILEETFLSFSTGFKLLAVCKK